MSYQKHLRIDHAHHEFSSRSVRGNHINGADGFWAYAKTTLARFRCMHPSPFYPHLKEHEFRFNHRHHGLYKVLLTLCRENPHSSSCSITQDSRTVKGCSS